MENLIVLMITVISTLTMKSSVRFLTFGHL